MTTPALSLPRRSPLRGRLRRVAGCLLCACSLVLSTSAGALQPSESDKETARDLVFAGDRAFREGDFAQALARYSTAYRLVQVPSVGIEVARAQVALGQLRSAYRSALAVVGLPKVAEEKPVIIQARADAAALANDLRERIPTLRLDVVPALPAAHIAIDGVAMQGEAARRGLWLDPGKHRVSVSLTSFVTAEIDLELSEREKRTLPVQLQPEKSAAVAGMERAHAQLARGQLRTAYRSALAVVQLARSGSELPASVQARADAATLASDLRDRIPRLRIEVTPPLPATRIAIDGVIMQGDTPRSGLWLDPGKHRVSVSAPGFRSAEIDFDLTEREKSELAVKLQPEPPRAPVSPNSTSSSHNQGDNGSTRGRR